MYDSRFQVIDKNFLRRSFKQTIQTMYGKCKYAGFLNIYSYRHRICVVKRKCSTLNNKGFILEHGIQVFATTAYGNSVKKPVSFHGSSFYIGYQSGVGIA